jgi:hypothetical protein
MCYEYLNPDMMTRGIFTFACAWLIAMSQPLLAQRYITENSRVAFLSETAMENIAATNTQSTSLFDATTGDIVFAVPTKGFSFKKSLMQQHFNESYLESDKYPKSTFKGKVTGFENKPGKQTVKATGELFIHGVTRPVTAEGTMELKDNGKLVLVASFPVKLEDYQVKIPKIVFYNIAESVQVKLDLEYKPYTP